jgi:hypothetical protein
VTSLVKYHSLNGSTVKRRFFQNVTVAVGSILFTTKKPA